MLTQYHMAILKDVATKFVRSRPQIQRRCCPNDTNGRSTRRRIDQLVRMGYLKKTRMEVVNTHDGEGSMPCYSPTAKALEFLAAHTGNDWWLTLCCLTPNWQYLKHWLKVSDFKDLLELSEEARKDAIVGGWFGEWDVVNPEETVPHKRYLLNTLITEKPKLLCCPDAAFQVCFGGSKWVCYLEMDRETTGIRQLAASKSPGYAAMAEKGLHHRHFESDRDDFRILSVSYTPERRNLVMKAMKDKAGALLWRFASWTDLNPATVLYGPVWHQIDAKPGPLVKTAVIATAGHGGAAGGPPVVRESSEPDIMTPAGAV